MAETTLTTVELTKDEFKLARNVTEVCIYKGIEDEKRLRQLLWAFRILLKGDEA
jgi:hypothetical protein